MRLFAKAAAAVGLAVLLCGVSCTSSTGYSVRTYRMGDRVQLAPLIYIAFDSQWLTHAGDGASARIPDQRFFLVRVSITNSGSAPAEVPALTITDEDGKEYTELANGDQVPQWLGMLRSARPAESLQGNIVFDCPPRRYKLKVTDPEGNKTALIDIPLTFASETVDVPSPEVPEKK